MQNESPLLKKARKYQKRKKVKIPRKGRIRFLLLLMLLAVSARFYFGDAREKTPARFSKSDQNSDGELKKVSEKKPGHKLSKSGLQSLSKEKVSEILLLNNPSFSSSVDTFTYKKHNLVYHFAIDSALQATIKKLFRRYHPRHGAAVAVDPLTGRILALASYNNPEDTLLGTDTHSRSLFPAASIFKTITAAAAVEKCRMSRSSLLKTCGRNHTLYNYQLKDTLDNYREVTLGEAFAYSINPVFGRLGIHNITAEGLRSTAGNFGFNQPIPFELPADPPIIAVEDSAFKIAEIASGFNQRTLISPLFGALISSSISRGGIMPTPVLIDSVTLASTGKLLYKAEYRPLRRTMSEETANELSELMQNVTRYGTARKSFRYIKRSYRFNGVAYGGKTGNVDKDLLGRIDWFVGFAKHNTDPTQHIATGVVNVHGPYWTVHSSFLGAEIIRKRLRDIQIRWEEKQKELESIALNDTTTKEGT